MPGSQLCSALAIVVIWEPVARASLLLSFCTSVFQIKINETFLKMTKVKINPHTKGKLRVEGSGNNSINTMFRNRKPDANRTAKWINKRIQSRKERHCQTWGSSGKELKGALKQVTHTVHLDHSVLLWFILFIWEAEWERGREGQKETNCPSSDYSPNGHTSWGWVGRKLRSLDLHVNLPCGCQGLK